MPLPTCARARGRGRLGEVEGRRVLIGASRPAARASPARAVRAPPPPDLRQRVHAVWYCTHGNVHGSAPMQQHGWPCVTASHRLIWNAMLLS